jgi:hypothetical protein
LTVAAVLAREKRRSGSLDEAARAEIKGARREKRSGRVKQ